MTDLKFTFVNRQDIPEIFADAVRHVGCHDGVFRIELLTTHIEHNPPNQPQGTQTPVLHLAMSPNGVVALRDQLNALLSLLEQQGMLQRNQPAAPPTQGNPRH